jgi:hypothetical protein
MDLFLLVYSCSSGRSLRLSQNKTFRYHLDKNLSLVPTLIRIILVNRY